MGHRSVSIGICTSHHFRTSIQIFQESIQCKDKWLIVSSSLLQNGQFISAPLIKFSLLNMLLVLSLSCKMNCTRSSALGGATPFQMPFTMCRDWSCVQQPFEKDFIEYRPSLFSFYHTLSFIQFDKFTPCKIFIRSSSCSTSH